MHIASRFYHRINQSREMIVRQGASPVPLRDARPLECEDIGGKGVFRTKRLAESQSIPLRSSSGVGFVLKAGLAGSGAKDCYSAPGSPCKRPEKTAASSCVSARPWGSGLVRDRF
jgi:hypothetical protein